MLHPGDLTNNPYDSSCRRRPIQRLDGALLARRLWLSQIAEIRHCTMQEAQAWEESRARWRTVAKIVGIGIAFTLCLILWGLP
jgi:hypothetical protein